MYRQLAIAGLVVLAAGCLGGPATTDGTTPDATVVPSETVVVTVDAESVGEIFITEVVSENVSVDFSNVSFSPSPDRVYKSEPPYWAWDGSHSSVTVDVPIRAGTDATPDVYRRTVTVYQTTDHSHENATEYPIVVEVVPE